MFLDDNYKDICIQIQMYTEIIDTQEIELYSLNKIIEKEKRTVENIYSYNRTILRIRELKDNIKALKYVLIELSKSKHRIKRQVASFEGIYYQVALLRDIKGIKLQEIATILNKSLGYIQNISSKINQM